MIRSLFAGILSCVVIFICGCGSKEVGFEAAPGIFVKISGLTFSKTQGKVFGYVQFVNKSDNFYKISNTELCLISNADTVRAFMKMPGDWEIDKGLVNIQRGKTLEYQAYWPIKECDINAIKVVYFETLSREIE
jgi:hypothetical protein